LQTVCTDAPTHIDWHLVCGMTIGRLPARRKQEQDSCEQERLLPLLQRYPQRRGFAAVAFGIVCRCRSRASPVTSAGLIIQGLIPRFELSHSLLVGLATNQRHRQQEQRRQSCGAHRFSPSPLFPGWHGRRRLFNKPSGLVPPWNYGDSPLTLPAGALRSATS
jgi:hypothetical protein